MSKRDRENMSREQLLALIDELETQRAQDGALDIRAERPERQFAMCLTPEQRAKRRLNEPLGLADPALQIYSTGGRSVLAVYDSGVELPLGRGDTWVASFHDREVLAQVCIPDGCYATCPGFVRLATVPTGQVTADLL